MISIKMLGGPDSSIAGTARYYLTPDHDCARAYYSEKGQQPGQWLGHGATALNLEGSLGETGAVRFVELLNAHGPDGEVLAKPVWRADPAGRLPSVTLLTALQDVAGSRGFAELFAKPADQAAALGVERRCQAPKPKADVDAAVAGRLATAVGLDPVEVFRGPNGTDRYTPAIANAGKRLDVRRTGIDVTVSAPKSVSVLLGLANPEQAKRIEGCHQRALEQALGYLERHAGHGSRGHQGDGHRMDRVPTDGWIVAAFTHYTSRAGDPQLHTHLVVPNLVHGQDGKWSALDSRAVHGHAKTAGYLYQAALRYEISQHFNLTWTEPVKGMAEINEVPREVLREFSTRRRQIEQTLARTDRKGRAAAQDACLSTRQRKTHVGISTLRTAWTERSRRLAYSPTELEQHRPSRHLEQPILQQLTREQLGELASQILGPLGVTEKQSGFDRRDLVQAVAVAIPLEQGGDAQRIEALADALLAHPEAVPLIPDADDQPRWTTVELLATEHRALQLATTACPATAATSIPMQGMSPEQVSAVETLNDDNRRVRVLVGPAGSGKTAVLATVRDLAEQQGQPVVGCALAALTAKRLEVGSGIPSRSLASLLASLEAGQPLAQGSLVVVDEAGMVGTRDLARLFEHAEQANGRVLLVGDPEQLPEIDAGGLFRHLSQPEARPAVLSGNQRQRHDWEAQALELLRTNNPIPAMAAYVRRDRILVNNDRDSMHAQVADDYLAAIMNATSPQQRRETVVLASYHSDVSALNASIREQLQANGHLGPDTAQYAETPYAQGDEVIVIQQCSDRDGRKVLNGTRGTVTRANQDGLCLQPDHGAAIDLAPETVTAAVSHGYALTIHKAQGLTATTALVVGNGLTRQSAYTALSRGRERNQLYLHEDPEAPRGSGTAFQRLCEQLSRSTGDLLASQQVRPLARPLATPTSYLDRTPPTQEGRPLGR